MSNIYPWQVKVFSQLLARKERLPHALLLTSPPGCGLSDGAQEFSIALLCEQPAEGGWACHRCQACQWVSAGSHPDLRKLGLIVGDDGKLSSQIPVDAVRALSGFLSVAGHRGGRRVVLIDPAQAMNGVAANALLKSLEEPSAGVTFLLISDRPEMLLPTIRSRCQQVTVPAPHHREAQDWLQGASGCGEDQAGSLLAASGGAPLLAMDLAEPARAKSHAQALQALSRLPEEAVSQVADALTALEAEIWLPLSQRWLMDIARVACGAVPRYFPQQRDRLLQLASRIASPTMLSEASLGLARQFRQISHPLNPRLFCEESLAILAGAFVSGARRPSGGQAPGTRSG